MLVLSLGTNVDATPNCLRRRSAAARHWRFSSMDNRRSGLMVRQIAATPWPSPAPMSKIRFGLYALRQLAIQSYAPCRARFSAFRLQPRRYTCLAASTRPGPWLESIWKWQCLYFRALPHQQMSFRPGLGNGRSITQDLSSSLWRARANVRELRKADHCPARHELA